jgi:DNA ligase 1
VMNVGYAAIRDALDDLENGLTERLGPVLLRTGDLGTAIAELFQQFPSGGRPPIPADQQVAFPMEESHLTEPVLTLAEARSYYEKLTTTSNNREKRAILREMLARATPLEAKYLIKILGDGMRIGLQEGLVESSIAKAFDQPLEKVQYANMLLGDIGECARLARYASLEQAQMKLLHPIKPMLASVEEDPEKILKYMEQRGLAEDKYDGIRAQVHKQEQEVKIFSRDLDDITRSFPDVVANLKRVSHSFLMDGEIVPYKEGRILSFALLQNRLGRKALSDEMLQQIPCRFFAFDLLFLDGQLLLDTPLQGRRNQLLELQTKDANLFSTSEQRTISTLEDLETCFGASKSRNNEGLVIKHPDSPYKPGKRGKQWLKLKRALVTLDVVVVAAEYGHGKRAGLLSDYTFAVQHNGELLTIGKAYSGITDKELNRLSALFHDISIRNEGFRHLVPPQVVFEVTFDRINRSDRHSSGFALRFPRIKNIRWDKKPDEIDTLETVEKLYLVQETQPEAVVTGSSILDEPVE